MTDDNNKVQEFGKQMQVSAEMLQRMDKEIFGQLIKENTRKDAQAQGYTEVSEPELFWGEQAFRVVEDKGHYSYVPCSPTDKGAFFYAGAKMSVVKATGKELA
jgi:hypothetical protein